MVYVSSPSAALETATAKWLGDCIYSWRQYTLITQNELLDEKQLRDDYSNFANKI